MPRSRDDIAPLLQHQACCTHITHILRQYISNVCVCLHGVGIQPILLQDPNSFKGCRAWGVEQSIIPSQSIFGLLKNGMFDRPTHGIDVNYILDCMSINLTWEPTPLSRTEYIWFNGRSIYRKISNIRRTKSQNLNVSLLALQLHLRNLLKSDVKSRTM